MNQKTLYKADRISFFSVMILLCCVSCKKFLLIETTPTLIEARDVFSNDQTAAASVAGLYSQIVSSTLSLTNGGSSVYPGLTSDELVNNSNPTYDPFRSNSILRTNTVVNNTWSNAYKAIYHANSVLLGLNSSGSISDSIKKQLTGEVKFIRGFYYFYLVNYFGDVPLITGTSYQENAVKPRTSPGEIYQQILSDLLDARNFLNSTYPSSGRVRANKWAAAAMLSRVYLYLKDWKNAEINATSVINSGIYGLSPNLNNVFLSTSQEAIWQLLRETSNTAEGNTFIPASATTLPVLSLTPNLLNSFEAGDGRKINWLKSNAVSGQAYFYPYKYKVRSGSVVTEYLIALRYAEQLLIRAEALAQQNKISDAQSDLNKIRNRAGLGNATANDQTSLLNAIEHERQIELFAEWGHRWFDLKRTGRLDSVVAILKAPNWQTTDALFPIPQEEIDRNPSLTQNPGY